MVKLVLTIFILGSGYWYIKIVINAELLHKKEQEVEFKFIIIIIKSDFKEFLKEFFTRHFIIKC